LQRSRPVVVNIRQDGEWAGSGPFRAPLPGRYRASLSLSRKYAFREMECLADVGMPFPHSTASGRRADCPPAFFPGRLDWVLVERDRPVDRSYDFGPNAGEYSTSSVGRSLGIFVLRRGATYTVRARISGAPPQLWATRPQLELGYDDTFTLVAMGRLVLMVVVLLGLIGLTLLLSALWSVRRRLKFWPS
jgi:hypothetical protein